MSILSHAIRRSALFAAVVLIGACLLDLAGFKFSETDADRPITSGHVLAVLLVLSAAVYCFRSGGNQ